MAEHVVKVCQSASPVARAGAGDLSERELCRERRTLYATPPARIRVHPKKLFSTPVSKFTCAPAGASSPHLARIRSCLEQSRRMRPPCPVPATPRTKAASMEDLTPNKRAKKDSGDVRVAVAGTAPKGGGALEVRARAAARVCRFLVLAAWRRRREEVLTLRRTLDSKRSGTERLRMQVCALKALLDADNAKVVLAMRELERLKQLLRDRELEKAVLEREKLALEKDVAAAEDRASELSIGWRNTRNELEAARAAAADARTQRDRAYTRINLLEEELMQREALLAASEAEAEALREAGGASARALRQAGERLGLEREARSRCAAECNTLKARVSLAAQEASVLRDTVSGLRDQLATLQVELDSAREQLGWWPRPLTRMLGAARFWLRHPMSLPEAVVWSLMPARHGCY